MPLYDPYGRPATGPISPEDLERSFAESKRQIEENAKTMLSSMDKIAETFEKTIDKMGDKLDKQREQAKQNFEQLAMTLGQGVVEVMARSLKAGMPGILGDIQPLFGKAGENIGGSAVKGIMSMLGKGGIWGTVAQIVGGQIVKEVGMQVEGYQMIGARVAPVATAGLRTDVNFDRLGAQYVRAMRDIRVATGATEDEIHGVADQLSKVGIGFLDGAQKEVQFALATERVMNLNRGMASSIQVDAVKNYGESLKDTRRMLNSMRDSQKEFLAISWQTNSSIARTLSSGQNLVDLLGQISVAGRNSGASLGDMNTMASSLVKAMVSAPGGPMFRPGQMGAVGAKLMQSLLPRTDVSMSEGAMQSGFDRMLMDMTVYGKGTKSRIEAGDPEHADPQGLMFNLQQQKFVTQGGRGSALQTILAKAAGLEEMTKKFGLKTTMGVAETKGMDQASVEAAHQLMAQLEKRGFSSSKPQNQLRILKDYLKETQNDPNVRQQMEKLGLNRETLDVSKEQGQAMLSSMDKLANTITDIRLWTHEYWANWRDATRDIFGLKQNDPWYKTLGSAISGPQPYAQAVDNWWSGGKSAMPAAQPPEAAPVVTSSRMVLDRGTAKANEFEMSTRDVNVKSR